MGDTFKVTASSDKTGAVNAIIEVVISRKGGYRRDVILAGAELYEARANTARELSGNTEGPDTLTLHTKAFLIDRRYVFVGSLNLDPRSIELNAEMGLLIDSEALNANLTKDEEQSLAYLTYRVTVKIPFYSNGLTFEKSAHFYWRMLISIRNRIYHPN